ncbi:MAG: glycosyltransferase [Caldilineaceae bacterium]|nr:glycosyltransferase [Caldilineaceae bacterium]
MKILFLTPQLPYPPRQGTTIRNYYLLHHLATRYTVDLLTFVTPEQLPLQESPLHQRCRRLACLPQPERSLAQRARSTLFSPQPDMALRLEDPAMHALVKEWLTDGYDLVQVEGIEMAQYGLHVLTDTPPGQKRPRLIFDDHNCEYVLQQRNAQTDLHQPRRWLAASYSLIQWQKLRWYERELCRRADAVLAVSPVDQQALEALAPGITVTVIANGVAEQPSRTPVEAPLATPPMLLFTGKMDYRPNVDAVLWFAEAVLPLIQTTLPAVRFQIVGMNPHPRLEKLRANRAIEITGAVESIDPYLAAATVYVVPLRVGGGTRFKVLEAMAQGKALVSTALGVEGLGVQHEQELLIADTPAAFAEAVIRLVVDAQQDASLSKRLGTQARDFVNRTYRWPQIMPRLEALYQRLLTTDEAIV